MFGVPRNLRADVNAPAEDADLAGIEQRIHGILERERRHTAVPGFSAAFALPDGRVGAAVAGFADVESRARMTKDTRFLAGSIGKTLHAALAVALAGEGVVDLDAPISRWIGDEPWFERLPNGKDLTLRLLLQHRTGLIDHIHSVAFLARELRLRIGRMGGAVIPPEELVGMALDRKPLFRAGRGFEYSDTNYVLEGLVIQRATGRSPFDQIEERFLVPLGLSGTAPARERYIPQLASGYQLPLNPFLLPAKMVADGELRVHPMIESTAGGFVATPRDLVRWAQALFEGRALPSGGVQEMTRDSVATGDGRRYGLGLYRCETPLGRAWGHGGYFPGYRSEVLYFPSARIAVAVQVNRDTGADVHELLLAIARDAAMASRSEMRTTGVRARSAPAARAPGSGPISTGTPD